MLIESLKHLLYSLATILLTVLAIPVLIIGELLYFLFSLSGVILGLPFIGFKYACRLISETAYLKICSLENKFIYKLKEFGQFTEEDEEPENEQADV